MPRRSLAKRTRLWSQVGLCLWKASDKSKRPLPASAGLSEGRAGELERLHRVSRRQRGGGGVRNAPIVVLLAGTVLLGAVALVRQTALRMWNEQKSRRLDELRREEARRALTEAEQAELGGLFGELDAEEEQALRPALDRLAQDAEHLRAEKVRAEAWARELERVVEQQEKLLAEARAYAGRLRLRRAALADEVRRLKAS